MDTSEAKRNEGLKQSMRQLAEGARALGCATGEVQP